MIKNPNDELNEKAEYQVLLEDSLYEFTKEAWRWVDDALYEDNWHIEVMCEHLQATYKGEISRLLISIAPSLAKSIVTSVMFPVWTWITRPHHQFLTGSNTAKLSIRDTMRARDLISSDWFQYHWGNKFSFSSDQNEKDYYKNNKFGHRYSFSTGARITGQRAHTIILDDALNHADRRSKVVKESVNSLISGGLSTRFNNEKTGVMVVIGQRLSKDDPIGYLLSKNQGWVHLNLPMEGRPSKACKTFLFEDTREEGESLWLARWTPEIIKKKKMEVGSKEFATQYNQQPYEDEGDIFKEEWLEYYRIKPEFDKIIDVWDLAIGVKKQNDFTVGATWGITKKAFYLIDIFRGKLKFPELKKKMVAVQAKYGSHQVIIEDAAQARAATDDLKRTTRLNFKLIKPLTDKVARAEAASPSFEAGNVFVPEAAPWLLDWIEEHSSFPECEHDDQVDTTSMLITTMVRPHNYDRLFTVITG